jgi:hypothetical protein
MNVQRRSISIGVFILLMVGMGVSIRWVAAGNEAAAPFGGVTAYGTAIHLETFSFLELDITNPESVTSTETPYFYPGIDFANDVFTTAYALNYDKLVTVDISTVAQTVIGAATPVVGERWRGMTWDRTTNTMYALAATTCTAQPTFSLYTLNLSTGAATRINTESRPGCVFDIAAHPVTGVLYALNLFSDTTTPDRIIAIDKTTTDISLVVELGFDANITGGHGMDFDDSTGVLYYGYSEDFEWWRDQVMYAVNVQGGPLETIYRTLQSNVRADFAIARAAAPLPVVVADPMWLSETHKTPPDITIRTLTIQNMGTAPLTWSLFEDGAARCVAANEIAWLSTDVTSGTIPVGGSTDVEVTFDSERLDPIGTVFNGALCLASNDQSAPIVPLRMELTLGPVTAVALNTLNTAPAIAWFSFGVVGIVALTGIVMWRRRQ